MPAVHSDETSEAISAELAPLPPKSASHVKSCPLDGGGGFAGWVWEGGWGEGGGFQRSSAENRLGAGAGPYLAQHLIRTQHPMPFFNQHRKGRTGFAPFAMTNGLAHANRDGPLPAKSVLTASHST